MAVFEIATHQNFQDLDIIACGKRREVKTLDEAHLALIELPDETYPIAEGHIDGNYVDRLTFISRLREYQEANS